MLPDTDYTAQDHDYADDEKRMKVMTITLMMVLVMMLMLMPSHFFIFSLFPN